MNIDKKLEEANKEVERSEAILQQTENLHNKKEEAKDIPPTENKEEGSGIFTTDGEELPKIEGGYDIVGPGGSLGNGEFVSI